MADKQVRVVMQIMDDTWKSELTPDMLGDTLFSTIAEEIGSDNLLKLSRIAGGDTIYIPTESGLLRLLRNKKVMEEYNGYNTKELAKKYGISRRAVYNIVNQTPVDNTN